MARLAHTCSGALAVAVVLLLTCPPAGALPPAAGVQAGRPVHVAARAASTQHTNAACGVELPVVGGLAGGACEAAGTAASAVGGLVGKAAEVAGSGILDLLARWMIGAASQVTGFVAREMRQTTTPQLQSAWFGGQFAPMADLGAALGLLVTLIGLACAAVRRSPQALAATLAGLARAGIGTGMLVALTAIGLGVADEVSSAVVTSSPSKFWVTVAHAWGTAGFGGFESSALAMLIALVEVFAAVFVWLELIVRDAAIYLAVLFFPVALAAAIWPALSAWPGRLGRLLLAFVILKPVALIVLSFAGNAAAAGLSFSGGVSGSVGTILAATVIFALAAFAPWALMYLLAADAESAYIAAGVRTAAAGAVTSEDGRSVRTAGGLRQSGNGRAGGPGAGSPGGGGSPGNGDGPGGGGSNGSSPAGGDGAGAAVGAAAEDGTLPVAAATVGAGSVGAAAGASQRYANLGASNPDATSRPEHRDKQGDQAAGADDETHTAGAPLTPPTAPPLDEREVPSPAAGGAFTDASPQRRGSAGAPASGVEEPSAEAPDADPLPFDAAGAPLPAGSSRGGRPGRSPALTAASAPAGSRDEFDEGGEEGD